MTAIVAGVEGDGSPGARLARTVQLTVPPPALFLVAGTGDDGREEFAPAAGLEVLAERPDAICNAGQDLLLLRRP